MHLTNSLLIAVLGPTGAGKSALALKIAAHCKGEIVNFDAVQVYKGLNIGSAKTPEHERQGIEHHLLDVVGPHQDFTAGIFMRLARECLSEISGRGKVPVLVGGTGFYLRSLLDGLSPAPPSNQAIRERLAIVRSRRPLALHRFLRRLSPASAQRIHFNDHQKVIRAIELALTAGEMPPRPPLSEFSTLKIGLDPPRAELYRRLNQRSADMFSQGLVEETQALIDAGVPVASRPLQSIGYKQALAFIDGRLNLNIAIAEVQTRTRQYAKRQMTWFRREKDVHWLQGFGDDAELQSKALLLISGIAEEPFRQEASESRAE